MTTGEKLDQIASSEFASQYHDLARAERDHVFSIYLKLYAVRVRPESMTAKRDRQFKLRYDG